jgi:hypothetical protein
MSIAGIPASVLENFPAGAPPKGVKPNFIDPPNHDGLVIALNTVLLTVMWTVVLLRLYAKGKILRTIGWDDCKLLSPLPFSIFLACNSTF